MIIKLSNSGKQVQVVDDDGCVFGTSLVFLNGLLEGRSPLNFVLMTRLPFKVAKGRFKPSPTWNPSTNTKEVEIKDTSDVKVEDDPYAVAYSYKDVKEKKENKPIGDLDDW